MATNFPTSLDSLTNPTSSNTLNSPDHAGQHADANDAIEALEAKVGVNGSAVTTSLDYKVTNGIHSALNVDSGTLYVDAANNYVGVNDTTPSYALDVTGTVQATQHLQGSDYLSPYNGFRNAIINGDFRINQRGWSSTSGSGGTISGTYGFDRWQLACSGGTETMSSQSFTVGSPAATGYESATFLRVTTSGQSASNDYCCPGQYIEDVRTLANSTVTVSFWAKASSGTPKVAVDLVQSFGTGGSPSADVTNYAGQVTLSTSWARYSVTYTLPNINGKTIGTTANTSYLRLLLWVSAGSSLNSRTGSIGIQNNTFDFWGVQVERGSVATPFEQRPIGTELALCQRYYEKSYSQATAPGTATTVGVYLTMGTTDGANNAQQIVRFCVPKRYASYTITAYNSAGTSGYWEYYRNGASNSTATPTLDLFTDNSFRGYVAAGAAYVGVQFYGHWVCNAEF